MRQGDVIDVSFRDLGKEALERRRWAMVLLGFLLGLQFFIMLGLQAAGWHFAMSTRGCSLGVFSIGLGCLAVVTGGRDWPTRLFADGFAALGAIAIVGFAIGL